jgi:co-chaperonin GroES (HSP10)
MEKQGVIKGVRIAFGSFSEYLFEIFGEKLYLMRNKKVMAILN